MEVLVLLNHLHCGKRWKLWGSEASRLVTSRATSRSTDEYDSEAGAPDDVPGTTSPGKAALNLMSDMIMDTDAVKMEIEVVKKFLLDDIDMVECNFSADELQELMSEIQLIEVNAESTQTMIDEYIDNDLANYTFGYLDSANISL